MVVKLVQKMNAYFPMLVTPLPIVTLTMLVQAQNARTRMEHSYVQTPAGDVHRAAMLVRDAARDFISSYRSWIEPYLTETEV